MKSEVKYVFLGTPEFAAIILEKLAKNGFKPQAVVCNPDKPAGRNKIITPPPVKIVAEKNGLIVLQPEHFGEIYDYILNLKPDLIIVAAYAKIIPKKFLEIPKLGTIGVHPSLLPKYRGSSPIQSAILNGEKETGVTLFMLDEKIDHGEIIAEAKLLIAEKDTSGLLTEKLANLGGELLVKTLPEFLGEKIFPKIQNESEATYTAKIKTEDAFINPRELIDAIDQGGPAALEISREIRAFDPEPGAWTILDKPYRVNKIILWPEKRIKILEAEISGEKLKLNKIQIAGKNPLVL
jgi:methionyl-tRNA formyltransferase